MATATTLLQQQQQQQMQQHEHTIELMCRICAVDFKIATEGVPIFSTDQLMDKIKNYLHIQVSNLDKLSHLICNECVRKIENFHCYAMMAHKNQELFNIMYSEKIYREHCTALSSLNTTLYREPPSPQVQPVESKTSNTITIQPSPPIKKQKMQPLQKPIKLPPTTVITAAPPQNTPQQTQQPVAVLSTEDITIFTYQDLKLGQVIKDQELQKLILRALKWNEPGKTVDSQLDRLKNASFRAVLNNPDLLRDEDLVQLLGPYLDHGSFAPLDTSRCSNMDFSTKPVMDNQNITEMEVGVDPDLFFPYDDDESKGMDVEVTKVIKPKKERKKSEARKSPAKKASSAGSSSNASVIAPVSPPPKIRIKAEGLFKSAFAHSSISKSTVSVPKPVIVVPPPKIVQPKPKIVQPKVVDDVPSVPVISEPAPKPTTNASTKSSSAKVAVEKPVIVQAPASSSPPVAQAQKPSKSTKSSSKSEESTPAVPVVEKDVASKKEKQKEKQKERENENESEKVKPSTKTDSKNEVTNSPVSTATTTVAAASSTTATSSTTTTTTTSSRSSPKVTPAKVEPKRSQPRKVKIDQSGPKTRARSVFNTRHKCAVCSKKFSTSGNLKAHVKTHKPKGKFNCDKCGRVFKTQLNLQRHKEYHSGEKFSCRTCGRVYPSNSTLKQHEISHSNFRPHKCNICLKTFKRSQDLKFHTNQHTGEKPYRCPFCPKAFASSGNCFSHRKRVHSDKSVMVPTTTSKRSSTVENSKKLVKA